MTESDFLGLLRESGAFQSGHFQLSSGLHSREYVQCALLLQYPDKAEAACRALADKLRQAGCGSPATIIGPALGAITVAYELARHLKARALFAERVEGKFSLRRGFALSPGEKVVVAENTITTGGSPQEVVKLVEQLGAKVIAVATLVDRSQGKSVLTVPLHSLVQLSLNEYVAADCPLCREGIPLVKPGSRPGKSAVKS